MNPVRAILLVIGLAVFIVGIYLLFFQADLDRWVSVGVLTAGIVVFIGVILMGFAGGGAEDREVTREVRDREIVREPRAPGSGGAAERRYRR